MSESAQPLTKRGDSLGATSNPASSISDAMMPSVKPLPHLTPVRPRQSLTIPNYAVHHVVPRHKHSLYQSRSSESTRLATDHTAAAATSSEESVHVPQRGQRQQRPQQQQQQQQQKLRASAPRAKVPLTIRDGTWRILLARDECVAREAVELAEIHAALATVPFPAPWSLDNPASTLDLTAVHPARARGTTLITQLEAHQRRTIEEDYTDLFRERNFRDALLRVRLMASNFDAASVHLRHWIARFRARKIAFGLRVARLVKQEAQQRQEWLSSSDMMQARGALLSGILMALESMYRLNMCQLYLTTAHATAVIGVRLAERAEALRVFFGGPMRAAKTCGRLSGLTVFSTLARAEQHSRAQIESAQLAAVQALPYAMKASFVEGVEEPQGRRDVAEMYRESVVACFMHVTALAAQYTLRDIEQYEAIARQQLLVHAPHKMVTLPPPPPTTTTTAHTNAYAAMIPDESSEESSDDFESNELDS